MTSNGQTGETVHPVDALDYLEWAVLTRVDGPRAVAAVRAEIERLRDGIVSEIEDRVYVWMQARNVLDHWRDGSGLTACDRSGLRSKIDALGYDGHMLAEELNELAERVS